MGGEERLPLEERAKEEQAGAEGSYQWGEASFDSALLKKELHLSPAAFGPLGIRYGSGKGAPWGSFHPRIGYYVKRFFSYSLDALSSPARSPPAPPPPPPPPPPSRLRNRREFEIESKIPPYPFALPPLSSSPSSRIGPWWEGAWVDYQRRGEGHLVKGLAMGREEERDKK